MTLRRLPLAMALVLPMSAQVQVTQLPSPGTNASIVLLWDTVRQRLLVVTEENPNRIKAYDGTSWQVVATAPFRQRISFGAAFDTRRGRVLLCCGAEPSTFSFPTGLWSWDGQGWYQEPSGSASPTGPYLAVYDPVLDRLVLKSRTSCDLHAWDGSGWQRLPGWNNCPSGTIPSFDASIGAVTMWRTELRGATKYFARYALGSNGWVATLFPVLRGPPIGFLSNCLAVTLSNGRQLIAGNGDYGWHVYSECNGEFAVHLLQQSSNPMATGFPVLTACIDLANDQCFVGGGDHCVVVNPAPLAGWWYFSEGACSVAPASMWLGRQSPFGPRCGTTWALDMYDATVAPLPLLLCGLSYHSYQGMPLPLDLSFVGMQGCKLQVSIDATVLGTAWSTRWAQFHVAVPAAPWLAGVDIGLQAASTEPGLNPAGVVLSNSILARIGL